jgi:hypothetical protein
MFPLEEGFGEPWFPMLGMSAQHLQLLLLEGELTGVAEFLERADSQLGG